jgi:hypothetical protein
MDELERLRLVTAADCLGTAGFADCLGIADFADGDGCEIMRWLFAVGCALCIRDLADFTCLVVAMSVATPFPSGCDLLRGGTQSGGMQSAAE